MTRRADLRTTFGSVPSFPVQFHAVKWFGKKVAWLAPEPDTPFRVLTQRVAERWPDLPPHGGQHPDPTPHLTIGDGASDEELKEAARLDAEELPISASPGRCG